MKVNGRMSEALAAGWDEAQHKQDCLPPTEKSLPAETQLANKVSIRTSLRHCESFTASHPCSQLLFAPTQAAKAAVLRLIHSSRVQILQQALQGFCKRSHVPFKCHATRAPLQPCVRQQMVGIDSRLIHRDLGIAAHVIRSHFYSVS